MGKRKTLLLLSVAGLLTFSSPVLTANAAWKTTTSGRMYTQSASPGYVTGFKTIGKYRYYFDSNGIMQTGFKTIKKKLYYFNSKGHLIYGWITATDGKKYYADKDGVLAVDTWVGDYYFQEDGSLAINTWVEGKWVGADGRFTGVLNNVGFVTNNGKTVYYDQNHKLVKGWLTVSGNTYYMSRSTGVLQKGWITVSGKKYYAESKKGVIQKSTWVGKKYLTSTGAMATGLTDINGKTYYFNTSGVMQTGWLTYKGKTYYLSKKGVMQKDKWLSKNTKYVQSDGTLALGMTTIGKYTYYFGSSTGIQKTGWKTINGNRYYFSKKTGRLQKNKWILSNKYYVSSTGAALKGLNAIGNNLYYFNKTTGKKLTKTKKTVSGATYYFQKSGAAAKNKWVKISGNYYYFQADGKMAKSTWIDSYYVNAKGVRISQSKTTGWNTVNGVKYYFDTDGNMLTGWQTINGSKYYFASTGTMLTGIQTIGTSKYYFNTDGTMAKSLTIIVGSKQYTINSKGVVTKEESLKVSENTQGGKIVNFALQYVGNPYVYGGTSLTKGADCSGFVQTVFANFSIKLLRVADDQMHGPSSAYIKQGYKSAVVVDIASIQPGDLLFYGSGNYASHVALYIGNGKIVHASNSQPYPAGGIKVSAYNYQTPLRAVRYWS